MGYVESLGFLDKNGIKIAETRLIKLKMKRELYRIKRPFIAKVDTKEPIHKTEFKAVKFIETEDDVDEFLKTVKDLSKMFHVNGIVIQEPLDGIELFVGGKRDPQFGPVVLFGLGGIFVEILDDVSIRLAPVSKRDAEEMIKEIRGYPALAGARGMKPIKMKDLIKAICGVSKILVENPDIKEIDVNPLFANDKYVKAADVRIIR